MLLVGSLSESVQLVQSAVGLGEAGPLCRLAALPVTALVSVHDCVHTEPQM